LPPHSQAE